MNHSNNILFEYKYVTKMHSYHTNKVREDYVMTNLHQKTLVFEFGFDKLKEYSELHCNEEYFSKVLSLLASFIKHSSPILFISIYDLSTCQSKKGYKSENKLNVDRYSLNSNQYGNTDTQLQPL